MGMIKADPRRTAVEILNRVDEGAFAEPLIDSRLSSSGWNNVHDRRLLTQLVYGVLRMRGRLDWLIESLYRGRFEKMDRGLKNILRIGLFQILFMDRIPDHAAVDESVQLTGRLFPGRVGLVNAILRNAIRTSGDIIYPELHRDPALHISIVHSHPLWLVEKWISLFGVEETLAFCQANNETPNLCLRVNRLKTSRDAVFQVLEREGCDPRKTDFSPDGIVISRVSRPLREMDSYKDGFFQVQDEASQLIAFMVQPQAGEEILDLCSGSGGKTTHLAEIMQDRGCILAIDINSDKLQLLRKSADRLGIHIIRLKAQDAAAELGESFHDRFDRILIDAPCSGLGTLRRNPEIRWRIQEGDLEHFPSLQRRIIDQASCYLKTGGILVYSTCTVMPEENENVIRDFLKANQDFHQVKSSRALQGDFTEAFMDESGFFRTRPHRQGMDGFFAVRMRKADSNRN